VFTIALPLLAALSSCGDLCSAEAAGHYARLNAMAALTRRDSERAAFLVQNDEGRLRIVPWQPGDATEASYRGRIPRGCIAIIHTHPIAAPRPSRRDVAEAQRLKLPIVVITPDAITVARTDGSVAEILGAGWTRRMRIEWECSSKSMSLMGLTPNELVR
jgi:proteasome lid subunit RPN8/RPN11